MPGFDRTGPLGQGPMTGGGFGYCTGRGQGYRPWGRAFYGGFGAGFGRGRFGRGLGPGYAYWQQRRSYLQPVTLDPKEELAELKREANDLRTYLKEMEARIEELESPSE
ncbi:MAG: DUF5320 domain-containing protein [Deltaproteobacteria bacterium]|nr:DUF5320 domain-containing protein [Deltaproteobacteria bacterium]